MAYQPNPVSMLLLLNTITSLSLFASAQTEFCSNRGVFAENSAYNDDLGRILNALPSNIISAGGFYDVSAGSGPDKVYAIAQCRGDVGSKECYDCVNSTAKAARDKCPGQKEAVIYGDICMLRYANRDIFGKVKAEPSYEVPNPNRISTNPSAHNATLYGLVGSLAAQASSAADAKFASGSARNASLHALVQCTADLSGDECGVCLRGALDGLSDCCGGMEGGRFYTPSCLIWFEVFKFYESSGGTYDVSLSPPLGPTSTDTSIKGKKRSTSQRVLIIVVPIVILVTFLAIACAVFLYRRSKEDVHDNGGTKSLESLQFDLSAIKEATDDFSDEHKLGQGGFGSVYKAKLPNGQEIPVKRLAGHSMQGEEEFMNEIMLVAKLQHRNLVSLLGFCSEAKERILVYEFVGNGSLDHFLFDPVKRKELNWERRYKIICGIARGILYLHEDSRLRVIHRDLKASNVLLDENMNPKIADFGMARLFVMDQSEANTRRHMGTYGYMAPEYALHGRFSAKSDVFSFGVLVLEIVSAKKNSWWDSGEDLVHLLSYTWKNWRERTARNVIDPTLEEHSRSEIMRCIHVGLLCVQENAELRPAMASAVLMLTSHSATLPLPSRPAFYMYNSSALASSSAAEESASQQSTSTNSTDYLSVT